MMAIDVLDLVRARQLLGVQGPRSLIEGVRALMAERDAAVADAAAMRELLVEEQKLRHEYGTRLARIEARDVEGPGVGP